MRKSAILLLQKTKALSTGINRKCIDHKIEIICSSSVDIATTKRQYIANLHDNVPAEKYGIDSAILFLSTTTTSISGVCLLEKFLRTRLEKDFVCHLFESQNIIVFIWIIPYSCMQIVGLNIIFLYYMLWLIYFFIYHCICRTFLLLIYLIFFQGLSINAM